MTFTVKWLAVLKDIYLLLFRNFHSTGIQILDLLFLNMQFHFLNSTYQNMMASIAFQNQWLFFGYKWSTLGIKTILFTVGIVILDADKYFEDHTVKWIQCWLLVPCEVHTLLILKKTGDNFRHSKQNSKRFIHFITVWPNVACKKDYWSRLSKFKIQKISSYTF